MIATLVPTGFFWGLVQIESMLKSCFIDHYCLLILHSLRYQLNGRGCCPVLHVLNECASGFPISLSWTPLLDFWLKSLQPVITRQFAAVLMEGSLSTLNPQASISSYCHFAFQNAWIISCIMIPKLKLKSVKFYRPRHSQNNKPLTSGIKGSLFQECPSTRVLPYTKYFECVNFEPNSLVCRAIVEWVYWVRLVSMASSKGKMGLERALSLNGCLHWKESEAWHCSWIIYPWHQVRERTWHF
jgi:hypothetical protein